MDFNLNFHPLDNLIKDKTSFWLEALVPFIDYRFKKLLILYIKYKEVTALLEAFEDRAYVKSCGFECKADSIDDVVNGLCSFMPKDFSDNILQMKKMLDMIKLMNQMDGNSPFSSSPDTSNIGSIMNMFGQMNNQNTTRKDSSDNKEDYSHNSHNSHDDFSDYHKESFSEGDDMYQSILSILDDDFNHQSNYYH